MVVKVKVNLNRAPGRQSCFIVMQKQQKSTCVSFSFMLARSFDHVISDRFETGILLRMLVIFPE